MRVPSSVAPWIWSLAFVGVSDTDDDAIRAQKAALTLAASLITALAVIWVGTYLVLGLPVSAAIPFAYQVASLASLIYFARSKSYHMLRFSQALATGQ